MNAEERPIRPDIIRNYDTERWTLHEVKFMGAPLTGEIFVASKQPPLWRHAAF